MLPLNPSFMLRRDPQPTEQNSSREPSADANATRQSTAASSSSSSSQEQQPFFQPPVVNLPSGGGAIQGIGEKFQANPVTGTGSMSVPVAMSPGRGGFTPQLSLSYDSGAGNSPFGLGWSIGLASISRKTSKGLPQYDGLPKYYDDDESDVFLIAGAEDLVPLLNEDGSRYQRQEGPYLIHRFIPRIEGLFARIERWTNTQTRDVHWQSISRENITTVFGRSPEARIFDPSNLWKIFSWLIEERYDDKGNVIRYQYKKENGTGTDGVIYEQNRNLYAQAYLKRVFYGNTIPYQPLRPTFDEGNFLSENEWLFELVCDYGEHSNDNDGHPQYEESQSWELRKDPYSTHRSGFEVRTYRLCRRLLMYHHMPEQLGRAHYLVKATHLKHEHSAIATQLMEVQHTGYMADSDDGYVSKSFPAVQFKYTKAKVDHSIYEISNEDLPNVPQGIDSNQYQYVDLYQESLSGILSQYQGAWYYKENMGGGKFGPRKQVATLPSPALAGAVQLTDYEGNGRIDALVQNGILNGYYELDEEQQWSSFRPFEKPLSIALNDPSVKQIDLNGDGIADLLLTENDCFVYYASQGKDGYKAARRVAKMLDEEQGPRVVFREALQTVFLADLTGDGMTDIMRIRNGEICYWPNLGYGRFGAKVTMAQAPVFDHPDYYDPARIRLADIDGSGTTDIMYLGRDHVNYWLNASGNAWIEQAPIEGYPTTTPIHNTAVFDLLGDGCSCLVWSSPLPAQGQHPIKYIRLMGETPGEGSKPYLLREIDNQMGAVTRLRYVPSTKFYLADKAAGKPWITRLPFVVQVLEQQEILDQITGNHFSMHYAYHHGYFDAIEREFRGFGMVESWDTQDFSAVDHHSLFQQAGANRSVEADVPPIYTKTWFHTGYWKQEEKISRQYEAEYYQGDSEAWPLPDTDFPEGLNNQEQREAARAIKGPLRVEVYSQDGSEQEVHPYTVTETMYHLKLIQPQENNRHASFYVCNCQTLTYHYERNPHDPRIAHESTLAIDRYGQITKAASVVYPRRVDTEHAEQQKCYATITEADFLHIDTEDTFLRLDLPLHQSSFELLDLQAPAGRFFDKEELTALSSGAKELLTKSHFTYYDAGCQTQLPFGEAAYHGIPYQTQEAVYTADQLERAYGFGSPQAKVTPAMLQDMGYAEQGGLYYRYSGKVDYEPGRFFLPTAQYDPLSGQAFHIAYDDYSLVMVSTWLEFLGHTIRSSGELDYRTLQPLRLVDANGNEQSVIFDALGMVVATAMTGKNGEGDSLVGYTMPNLNDAEGVKTAALNDPHSLLQGASTFFFYDLFAFQNSRQQTQPTPNYALSIVREVHTADEQGTPSPTQVSFSYSDGLGQALMVKIPAEPGEAFRIDANGDVETVQAARRWVGNGRTILDNKGNAVKQYEPYFSATPHFESEVELVEYGVTPILHYDPLNRNIRTDFPDGTFTRVEFTPWEQRTYDPSDNTKASDWYLERELGYLAITGNPLDPAGAEPKTTYHSERAPGRAAWLSAQHDDTPQVQLLDTLGRVFMLIDDDGSAEKVKTRFVLNLQGSQVEVWDALGRLITINVFNLLQQPIRSISMDGGERQILPNMLGNPVLQWNERGFTTRMLYDDLQRNNQTWISDNGAAEQLVYLNVYGEQMQTPAAQNAFGQLIALYDQAGLTISDSYDFKGNPHYKQVRVAQDYKNTLDYGAAASSTNAMAILSTLDALLEPETFATRYVYDALNRPLEKIHPDESSTSYRYNEANLLDGITLYHHLSNATEEYVENIDYDAKGQRTRIRYGNGVTTRYDYDPLTFRLVRLFSTRNNGSEVLQDLNYHYDASGNITDLFDHAQQTIFYANQQIKPHGSYTYDPLYRLICAEGREHIGQASMPQDPRHSYIVLPASGDGQAMRPYKREYDFDKLGNILQLRHRLPMGGSGGWTRTYEYQADSRLEPGKKNNYLTSTYLGSLPPVGGTEGYTYDPHGNMTSMSHLSQMRWNFSDELQSVDLGSGGHEYYTYTLAGGKDFGVRRLKVTEKAGGKICIRIYVDDYEIYRERTVAAGVELERSTLHIQDDKGRLALVDTLTIQNGTQISPSGGGAGGAKSRYQLSDHLGSAAIELDGQAQLISYETYYPFGATSYQAGRSAAEVKQKRYRYAGKERDQETGLDYYGARYYASWLGRWCSADPAGFIDGYNLFQFVQNNPLKLNDKYGFEGEENYVYTLPTIDGIEVEITPSMADDFFENDVSDNLLEWLMLTQVGVTVDIDQTLEQGDGDVHFQKLSATVEGTKADFDRFKSVFTTSPQTVTNNRWATYTPIDVDYSNSVSEGDLISIDILGPDNGSVRVAKVNSGDNYFEAYFQALDGHPEAGNIRFKGEFIPDADGGDGGEIRFEIFNITRTALGAYQYIPIPTPYGLFPPVPPAARAASRFGQVSQWKEVLANFGDLLSAEISNASFSTTIKEWDENNNTIGEFVESSSKNITEDVKNKQEFQKLNK